MEGKDERLDLVRSFTVKSLRLDEDRWQEFVSEEKKQVIFNSFLNARDYCHLFICEDPDSRLSVSLDFPQDIRSKVICVSKTVREAVTRENSGKVLIFQEVQGEDVLNFIICITEQVR